MILAGKSCLLRASEPITFVRHPPADDDARDRRHDGPPERQRVRAQAEDREQDPENLLLHSLILVRGPSPRPMRKAMARETMLNLSGRTRRQPCQSARNCDCDRTGAPASLSPRERIKQVPCPALERSPEPSAQRSSGTNVS